VRKHPVIRWVERSGNRLDKEAGQYWNLSRYDERIQDQSHWCGSARWDRGRWLEYGEFHEGLVLSYLRRFSGPEYFGNLRGRTALDWGCGGGANTRTLCLHFGSVIGVDISEPTTAECGRQMRSLGVQNFRGIFFDAHRPEALLKPVGREAVDFFFSVAVFQHFPSKSYTLRVLGVMEELMKPGAFGLIQVRYFDGSEKLQQKEDDYARNVIYMTSFTTDEFTHQLNASGFTLLFSERDLDRPEDRHEYFFFRK
jgi:2-polyprenyl-3-methyl-5-hydroxy-6-metoxy-1,4-benzoquinol methylase